MPVPDILADENIGFSGEMPSWSLTIRLHEGISQTPSTLLRHVRYQGWRYSVELSRAIMLCPFSSKSSKGGGEMSISWSNT